MEQKDYVGWLREESMLAEAGTIAGQFSGIGGMFQNPFANPNPGRDREGVGVVHRLSHLDDHTARPFVSEYLG